MRIAVIGAGLTGLTAARALQNAGLAPVLYDKGRGVGGRLSTRRAQDGLQFDHGAQYLSASDPAFASMLADAEAAGAAAKWQLDCGAEKTVGLPGMNGVAKFLATGCDIRQGIEIDTIRKGTGGWIVAGETYDRVICTVPAPQAIQLVGTSHPLSEAMEQVVMEPNLTLMLALPGASAGFQTYKDSDDDIAWLALDSSKHARPGPECWVAQAGLAWSNAHLELEKEDIAKAMLPLVCKRLGASPSDALYVAAHRWRYAQTSAPLGQPFLTDDDTLFLGGDWALSDRAEGAWQSGSAMARALLVSR